MSHKKHQRYIYEFKQQIVYFNNAGTLITRLARNYGLYVDSKILIQAYLNILNHE